MALPAAILALYAAQSLAPAPDAVAERLGFSTAAPWRDHGAELVTALFVHAGWAHAGMNALAALAFAAPVARRLGSGVAGFLALLTLYLASGAAGSLAFAAVSPGSLLVGASGAVSGLMGAASRLPPPPRRDLLGFGAPPVLGMAASWILVNLAIAAAGLDLGTGGAPVAWQAHLGGYAAGLALIGPAVRLVRPAAAAD